MKIVFDFTPEITHKHYERVQQELRFREQADYDYWLTCDNLVALDNLMDEFCVGITDDLVVIIPAPDWETDRLAQAIAAAYAPRVQSIYFSAWEE